MSQVNPEKFISQIGLTRLINEQAKAHDPEALVRVALLGDLKNSLMAFVAGVTPPIPVHHAKNKGVSDSSSPTQSDNPNNLTPAQVSLILAECAGFLAKVQTATANAQENLAKINADVSKGISDGLQVIEQKIADAIKQQAAEQAQQDAWGIVAKVFAWVAAIVTLCIDPAAGIMLMAMNIMTETPLGGMIQDGLTGFFKILGVPDDIAKTLGDITMIAICVVATMATGGASAASLTDEAAAQTSKIMKIIKALLPSGRTALAMTAVGNGLMMTHLLSDLADVFIDVFYNGDPKKKKEAEAIASIVQMVISALLSLGGSTGMALKGGTQGADVIKDLTNVVKEGLGGLAVTVPKLAQYVAVVATIVQGMSDVAIGSLGIEQYGNMVTQANAEADTTILNTVQSSLNQLQTDVNDHLNDELKAQTHAMHSIVDEVSRQMQATASIWEAIG